jgi:predicted HTH domain antitoxin
MIGLMSELRATMVLSILDTIRQRGLSVEAAAEIADVDVGVMRALVERRDYRMLDVYALGRVMEALEAAPESGRKL